MPPTTSVAGDAGALSLTYAAGALAVRFREPFAVSGDSTSLLSYELWQVAEQKREGANLHTWCGVGRASMLLAKIPPAELKSDKTGGGVVLSVELIQDGSELCATVGSDLECLRWGDAYSLTLVAVSTPVAGGVSRRAVYAPALWRAGHKHGGAGMSFFGGLFLFLSLANFIYVAQWLVCEYLYIYIYVGVGVYIYICVYTYIYIYIYIYLYIYIYIYMYVYIYLFLFIYLYIAPLPLVGKFYLRGAVAGV